MTDDNRLAPEDRVVLDQPETQNLLGLLLHNIVATNLADDAKYARVRAAGGDVRVQAGEMVVTLRLGDGRLTIIAGPRENPRAQVKGDMGSFLKVARGVGVVGPVLSGSIRIRGNPFLLLKLMPLLQVSR